jgi:hypothetical protein
MRVCARCVYDHVHLQIVHRPMIAPNAVAMPAHSQTVVCGLRNNVSNSKTLRDCERQCRWMFTLFAIRIKWQVVCVLPQAKMWARNFSEGDMDKPKWRYRYSCTVGCYCPMTEHERKWFTLPAIYVSQTWNKVHDMENKKREY